MILLKLCLETCLDVNMLTRKYVCFPPKVYLPSFGTQTPESHFSKPFKGLPSNCLQSWPLQYAYLHVRNLPFSFFNNCFLLQIFEFRFTFYNSHRRKICVLNMPLKIIIWTMNELSTLKNKNLISQTTSDCFTRETLFWFRVEY